MEDTEFLTNFQLFDSIGVVEKGISKIYHYLILHKKIENLKDICERFSLSLKRGYKICSVLNELKLVQIYDRPMKVQLTVPVVPIWQRIINKRIEDLKNEFQDKKSKAEGFFEEFLKKYKFKGQESQDVVEFIGYSDENMEEIYYPFLNQEECKVAIGIRYNNPFISMIRKKHDDSLSQEMNEAIKRALNRLKKSLNNIKIQVIFNQEIIKELINSKKFEILSKEVGAIIQPADISNIDVKITNKPFSNFSLIENALVQPSFDPSNELIGLYISRNRNIHSIFDEKFDELFEKGTSINKFVKESQDLKLDSLDNAQQFILCLL